MTNGVEIRIVQYGDFEIADRAGYGWRPVGPRVAAVQMVAFNGAALSTGLPLCWGNRRSRNLTRTVAASRSHNASGSPSVSLARCALDLQKHLVDLGVHFHFIDRIERLLLGGIERRR